MKRLHIQHLGPIESADVTFGDFTLLVGPQASGKSIFLQMVKLIEDRERIEETLAIYGYTWKEKIDFLELIFGEGMASIWNKKTSIFYDDIELKNEFPNPHIENSPTDKVFYIPAQRVIVLQNGWPKPYSDFNNEPYVLKAFSESLRLFMEKGKGGMLLTSEVSNIFNDNSFRSIYYNDKVQIDVDGHKKRFALNIDGNKMPFSSWSAGQKEYMPLLLGLGILYFPTSVGTKTLKTVIVEEPEMGLHPKAIEQIIVQLLILMAKGYNIIVSTHSPVFLEFAWAMQFLKENNAHMSTMSELFGGTHDEIQKDAFQQALEHKTFKTYYFNRYNGKVNVEDISTLDAGSDNPGIADWGGITSFASRAAEIVAKNIAL